jgi:hypothetical protein
MEIALDSKLPVRLGISNRKKLLSLLSGIIFAPLTFFVLNSYLPPLQGLTSSESALAVGFIVGIVSIFYPFFLSPYIRINENAVYVRAPGLWPIEWPFAWKDIQTFKVVETHLPIGGNFPPVPYKKKAIGLDYKEDLPIDPLSNKQDPILKKLYAPSKFFIGAQVIFPDSTTIFDKTIYSSDPEELVSILNEYKKRFGS